LTVCGLAGDEIQRHQRRIGHRVVEIPDDQRQRVHHLGRADHLGDVLDPMAAADRPATSISL